MNAPQTTYRFLDYFAGVYRKVRCEIVSQTTKSCIIKLLEFGPKGRPPGSLMRVHMKSLDWQKIIRNTDLPCACQTHSAHGALAGNGL